MFIARYWDRDREGPYFFDLKLKWDYNQPLLFMNIILNFKFSVLLKRIASKVRSDLVHIRGDAFKFHSCQSPGFFVS